MASRQRSRWLAVEPGEGGRVGLLFGLFFFLALGYVLGQAGGYALFVQRFGARDLPFAFLLIPVVGAILAIGNLRIAARVGLGRMLLVDVAGMVAVSLAVRLGVAGDGRAWLLFSLPVWDAGVNTLSNVVVWNTASRLFDVRQVRRLVPLVAAGRSLALVVGGGLVPAVVHGLGTRNLYVLQTAMFVVALVLLVGLVRVHQAVIHETAASRRVPEPPGDTDRRRFVWSIFVVVFVSMLAYVLVRYLFLDRGATRYPVLSDYAAQIGLLNAAQGLATIVCGVFVTNRFVRRFGLAAGLVAMPVTLLLVYTPFVLLGRSTGSQFALAATGFVAGGATMFAIRTPSIQVMYQPLDARARVRALSTAEGVVEPLALGCAALVLLVVTRAIGWGAVGLAGTIVVVATCSIVAAVRAFGGYRRAIHSVLGRRWLQTSTLDLSDPATADWLMEQVERGDVEHVAAAVNVLDEAQHDLAPLLIRLVAHPDAEVRTLALQRCLEPVDRAGSYSEPLPDELVAAVVAGDPSPDVRAAAARLAGRRGLERAVGDALTDADAGVRAGALTGLLESPTAAARDLASAHVGRWVTSSDAGDRVVAARALAIAADGSHARIVAPLLADGDLAVRRSALAAVARVGDAGALPAVVAALGTAELRDAAADALVTYGRSAVPLLRIVVTDGARPPLPQRALRVMGRIPGDAATEVLVESLTSPHATMRGPAAELLAKRGAVLDATTVHALIKAEAARAAAALDVLAQMPPPAPGTAAELLSASLWDVVRRAREQTLALLVLDGRTPASEGVVRALLGTDSSQRAFALEALDTSLPPPFKAVVLPMMAGDESPDQLVSRFPHDVRPDPTSTVAEGLEAVAAAPDPWLSVLARHELGDTRRELLSPGGANVVPIIERVLFLKRVDAFAGLPTDTLADVAEVLHEVTLGAGHTLFRKGDLGTSMYLVADGRLVIHDGDRVLDHVHRHDVFGELAALDAEPRTASVTAEIRSLLYRLDQEPLYELMQDRPDLVRGIMRNIVRTLRIRMADTSGHR